MPEALEAIREVAAETLLELRRARQERDDAMRRSPEYGAGLASMRRPLHKPDFTAALIERAPGFAEAFRREIPTVAWTLIDHDHADVSCPCGEVPTVPYGVPKMCECGRAFLFTGEGVRCAFTPEPEAEGETPAAAVD